MIYIELYGKPEASQACDMLDILLHVCDLKTWSLRWHNPYLGPVACYCVCVCCRASKEVCLGCLVVQVSPMLDTTLYNKLQVPQACAATLSLAIHWTAVTFDIPSCSQIEVAFDKIDCSFNAKWTFRCQPHQIHLCLNHLGGQCPQ